MASPVDNLLVLQAELVDLLKTALADVRPAVHILTPSDLASDTDTDKAGTKTHPVPAVNVVYMGHQFGSGPDQQRTDGKALLMQQRFVAEVVTRSVRSLKSGSAARDEGGALAMRVLLALMGAALPSAASRVSIRPGPGPVYRSGMQYLPLLVQTSIAIYKP